MVERLASFFRVNLATNPDVDISLAEEIALQTTYLEIEQTRYPDLDIRIDLPAALARAARSEEHTSELQSLMRISYAVFCLKKKKNRNKTKSITKNIREKPKNKIRPRRQT